ncbi:hypothetical protein LEP1GSC188_0744 [Leptospira weilii serovar Topaz str. LT2116]|uniref:Uncharacterized protein n=1 Tax=Leptospira weilii serovar Topaz str. LT2116 TaxID=1088540 RepID=M3ELF4_9LEPT|nr:hypothetical protein LEP1GSC188_0744 [Leptospira weilii serovar Topaz str. LT2116]
MNEEKDIPFLEITAFSNEKLKNISNLKEKNTGKLRGFFLSKGIVKFLEHKNRVRFGFKTYSILPNAF